jgi:hypothetical protein
MILRIHALKLDWMQDARLPLIREYKTGGFVATPKHEIRRELSNGNERDDGREN